MALGLLGSHSNPILLGVAIPQPIFALGGESTSFGHSLIWQDAERQSASECQHHVPCDTRREKRKQTGPPNRDDCWRNEHASLPAGGIEGCQPERIFTEDSIEASFAPGMPEITSGRLALAENGVVT
jgi:hypothetical protein